MVSSSITFHPVQFHSCHNQYGRVHELNSRDRAGVLYNLKPVSPFCLSLLPSVFKVVEILHSRSVLRGIGVENRKGGTEVVTFVDKPMMFTISNPGVVFIPAISGLVSMNCRIFLNLLDYMAFLTLKKKRKECFIEDYDCFILNDVRNYVQFQLDIDDYEEVYSYMPNNLVGNTIYKTLFTRKTNVENCISDFMGFQSLFDCLLSLLDDEGKKKVQ